VEYTYEFPDPTRFMHTLKELLTMEGDTAAVSALARATCEFATNHQYSSIRWDSYSATITVRVPVADRARFTKEIEDAILAAAAKCFPPEAGFELQHLQIAVALSERPPSKDEASLNMSKLKSTGTIQHDGLLFRSRTETKVYDELKKRRVLFFPNATAILGGKDLKREPDFLICSEGKWGILEVMGEPYHPAATAMQDHDRARLFNDYRITVIQFYESRRCFEDPAGVVEDFLRRLSAG
jgi:hypothetical protein